MYEKSPNFLRLLIFVFYLIHKVTVIVQTQLFSVVQNTSSFEGKRKTEFLHSEFIH